MVMESKYNHENIQKIRELIEQKYKEPRRVSIPRKETAYKLVKKEIYEILGKKCVRCGFEDIRALQIDHKNGGGNLERKVITGFGINYTKFVLEDVKINKDKNYQILCANCNWIKRAENTEIYNGSSSYTLNIGEIVAAFPNS